MSKGLGFSVPPRVSLNLKAAGAPPTSRRKIGGGGSVEDGGHGAKKKFKATSGHGFSASNPYGKRQDSDKRQFVRY